MARLTLPSRLELKRPAGSFKEAPLAERNRATARAAAEWMARYFTLRDRPWHAMIRRAVRLDGVRVRVRSEARRAWPAVRRHLPSHVAHRLRRTARRFM
jgi:hypothetical protein